MKKHQPFHLYLDNEIYFITSRTYEKESYFKQDSYKQVVLETILEAKKELCFRLYAYSIVNNHYHLLIDNLKNPISKIIKLINGRISYKINKIEGIKGRKMWQNYWDWCLRNEKDFYMHFNYIHNNPIKHGLVKNLEELEAYRYCSYQDWVKKRGEDFLLNCFEQYPIIDYQRDD